MPLSGIGLWEAEIITPRSAPSAAGQVGDARGRQHAEAEHVDAGGGQAGHDRGLEELPGDAGVAADDGPGPVPLEVTGLAEHVGSGHGQVERQLGGQATVGQAPDPVGAEEPSSPVLRRQRSALAVLRRLAGLLQTGLLALDDAGVTGQQPGLLERRAVGLDVDGVERTGPRRGAARRPGR